MNRHLQSVFHGMANTRLGKMLSLQPPKERTPEEGKRLEARRKAELADEDKARATSEHLGKLASNVTRQQERRKAFAANFRMVSEEWNIPRRVRRSIARDLLRRARAEGRVAA